MEIFVAGLWHLGCVTAACLAKKGYSVVAYDPDSEIIAGLKKNKAPIYEPELENLLSSVQITFTSDYTKAKTARIIWITFDIPVDENDNADIKWVNQQIELLFPHLSNNAVVIISSQLPVGTTRQLQNKYIASFPYQSVSFVYIPENLRLGKSIQIFSQPDRIVLGLDNQTNKKLLEKLLSPFTQHIVWMSIESAEMTKHAINAFLATSVTFINEIASLCEKVGADAREVELGLKSEERIGTKAYLRPGNAIAGGTLLRDVSYLNKLDHRNTPLIASILKSNDIHKQWPCKRISEKLKNLQNKVIAALGLTYKTSTDTLRRSAAIETCLWLNQQGAMIRAYDPQVTLLPEPLSKIIDLKSSIEQTLIDADAIVINTDHPQFMDITAEQLLQYPKQPIVFDANGVLLKKLQHDKRIHYFSVGCES